jgi:leader peptidase (prepilin peptidase)/N-methyltransferase
VKLGVFMGFILGWGGAFCALLLANLLGTIYILPLMAARKLRRTDHVPFGPFLIAATFIVFLWGRQWFSQYLSAVGL